MKQSSRSSKTPSKLSKILDQHLNMYSLAAGMAGLGGLALASPAEAKIVYTPAHVTLLRGHSVLLDLNNDGINDFNLSNFYSSITHESLAAVFPYNNKGNALLKGPVGCGANIAGPAALKAGARIGAVRRFDASANCMAFVPGHSTTGAAVGSFGSWRGVAHRYLGVQFQINGKTHYGWVRLNVTRAPFVVTLTGYAYETVPKRAIIAGKTKDLSRESVVSSSSQPMPGTLGVLALGALGFSVWRPEL
jgi:hypothetical protein